ncbi:pectinesterase [Medicago truncatula]|uniref:Pectinesterase n=1 Tax=Medicago truncatula TaxID=3880 RepID=G7ITY9_MEDTR|nr:pectinesterase [Medicago truncatula]
MITMDNIIQPDRLYDHFGDTPKPNLTEVYYGEYRCSGSGSNLFGRSLWIHRLIDTEAQPFISTHFIEGDAWLISPS